MRPRSLTNADLAELLARRPDESEGLRQRAFRRAARNAFLWPEEARDLVAAGRPLTELQCIGPFLSLEVAKWLSHPPAKLSPPELRRDFLTLAEARRLLAVNSDWAKNLRGDLQMHTQWSDGSGSITAMAAPGLERGYEYIAITDHSKGLKIAGGIDELALAKQGDEIALWNKGRQKTPFRVLRSHLMFAPRLFRLRLSGPLFLLLRHILQSRIASEPVLPRDRPLT